MKKLNDVKNKPAFFPVSAFHVACVFLLWVCIQCSYCHEHTLLSGQIHSNKLKRSLTRRSYSAPVINVFPSSMTVTEGDTALLYCQATGNPQPIMKWEKLKSSLPLGRYSMQTSGQGVLLLIRNVKLSDQGKYQCKAKNTAQGQATAFATLTVKAKPVQIPVLITKTPESIITKEGENVTFTCDATGIPVPTVTWSKAFSTENSSIGHSQERKARPGKPDILLSTLTLVNVTANDSGLYVCKAENQMNSVTRWAQLMVVRPPVFQFTTKPPPEYTAIEGHQIVLPCQARNAESIRWTSSKKTLVGRAVQHSNGTLVIPIVTPKDHGVYTCQAQRSAFGSVLQTITASTHLMVIESSHGLEHSSLLRMYPARYTQTLIGYLGPVLQSRTSRWVKCWHATNDGWDVLKKFHAQCDHKGPTVTIAQYRDYVFGGYTDTNWKTTGGFAGESTFKSFLFSLSNIHGFHPVKMILRGYDNYEAIYNSKFFGPRFGAGTDMKLVRNSWYTKESYMRPSTYFSPPGCEIDKYCTFYTGTQYFRPYDIEVFYEVTN